MPGRWVTRKDLDGLLVDQPMACFVSHAIVAEPGLRTVEQCIEDLLEAGERVHGDGDDRQILKNEQIVGFIEIRYRIT
jgi:hypothetical protein